MKRCRCRCRQTGRRVERLGMRIVNTINQCSCLPYLYLCISYTNINLLLTKGTLPRPQNPMRKYEKDYISKPVHHTSEGSRVAMKGSVRHLEIKSFFQNPSPLTQQGNDFLQLPRGPKTHQRTDPHDFEKMMKSKQKE